MKALLLRLLLLSTVSNKLPEGFACEVKYHERKRRWRLGCRNAISWTGRGRRVEVSLVLFHCGCGGLRRRDRRSRLRAVRRKSYNSLSRKREREKEKDRYVRSGSRVIGSGARGGLRGGRLRTSLWRDLCGRGRYRGGLWRGSRRID
jgi:hypothetical protein